jgi:GT2 family glycosyltransferase
MRTTPASRPEPLADLAVVIVSTNEARWLEKCLTTVFACAGEATLQVIVVDNESTDGTRELVESHFPQAQVVNSVNRGFAHGNNRGLEHARARYLLLLNPDTEVVAGTFGELLARLDERPDIGLAGVRQLNSDGSLGLTMRRLPSISRVIGDALLSERWPAQPKWAGERITSLPAYEVESDCDWTSGSFMLMRREAMLAAGMLDERFFIYSEEPDLCLRIKQAGWKVMHMPQLTIVHHAGKAGIRPRMVAQDAYARKQYAEKHLPAGYRQVYLTALAGRHLMRIAGSRLAGGETELRRDAAKLSLMTLAGRVTPPFGEPPATAVPQYEPPAPVAAPQESAGADVELTPARGSHETIL